MTDMLVKAAENVNIVNNLNNLLMRYGHGRAARLKSRISNQSCSVQSSFKSENPAERILWQVRLKKKNKIILMFLKPSFEYFGTLPPDAALDALSIFRTFRLMAFILPVPVLFIAISSSCTSLVSLPNMLTRSKITRSSTCRAGNMMGFLHTNPFIYNY